MPEELKQFLQSLTKEQAEELWAWCDGNTHCYDEMINIVAPIAGYSNCKEDILF